MKNIEKYLGQNGYLDSSSTSNTACLVNENDIISILKNEEAPILLLEGLPFIIANEKFDLTNLTKLAISNNLQNKVGYLLEKTKKIVGDDILVKYDQIDIYAEILYQQMLNKKQFFSKFDKTFGEYGLQELGELEQKWKIHSKLNFEHSSYKLTENARY